MAGKKPAKSPKPPSNSGNQTADGKFAKGNKLSKGRQEGSRNKATLACQDLLDGEAETLTKKAVNLAKGGDMAALRLCLDRIMPPRKDRPISLALPGLDGADSLESASSAILKAVAAGDITPSEGQTLTMILEGYRKVVELADIERRVAALEREQPNAGKGRRK